MFKITLASILDKKEKEDYLSAVHMYSLQARHSPLLLRAQRAAHWMADRLMTVSVLDEAEVTCTDDVRVNLAVCTHAHSPKAVKRHNRSMIQMHGWKRSRRTMMSFSGGYNKENI